MNKPDGFSEASFSFKALVSIHHAVCKATSIVRAANWLCKLPNVLKVVFPSKAKALHAKAKRDFSSSNLSGVLSDTLSVLIASTISEALFNVGNP